MKMCDYRRCLLDDVAPILKENKRLQVLVNDLVVSLTRARQQEEELEL